MKEITDGFALLLGLSSYHFHIVTNPSNKKYLLTISWRCFFCGSFMLFLSCFVMLSCASVYWYPVVTCWERADLLASVCDVYCEVVPFPLLFLVRCGNILLTVPRRYFFCGSFMFFSSVLCLLCLCSLLFICALWSPAGKRADLLALVCGF